MPVFYGKTPLIAYLKSVTSMHSNIGFVPTMGALHKGHLALIQQALQENEITVVSIFVNPTQFDNPEDLIRYPRSLEEDVAKVKALDSKIIVYAPSVSDIYDGHPVLQHFDFDGLENRLEGKFRPGHFNGVGTIVKRLFEIIVPTNAYFGEKDFQQVQIVKKLVAKNDLNITIVNCPVYREPNQLAMSSRNERLSDEERDKASIIYQTLFEAKKKFKTEESENVIQYVQHIFESHPLIRLEYFAITDEETLLPCIIKDAHKKYRAFIAVFINNVRLIDTIPLN